jgi:hypothetical protein
MLDPGGDDLRGMTRKLDDSETTRCRVEALENQLQRPPVEYGLGARIMPVSDGWRVDFFSVPDFEQEPGTTYDSLEDAVQILLEWLPKVNSPEERDRARAVEEELRRRMNDEHS